MKKIAFIFLLFLYCICAFGQQQKRVLGNWLGVIKTNAIELRIVFRITEENGVIFVMMDSPDQGAKDIKVTKIDFRNDTLDLSIKSAGVKYTGVLQKGDSLITGEWKQNGKIPLDLKRTKEAFVLVRPQEPKEPFPYDIQEVTFDNKKDNVTLAGTLTIPKTDKPCAAVILITGSGRQNRDEEILGHKPFWIIADYLSRNGIAVLRYDDRGTAKSTGNFAVCTTEDFARDAKVALDFLKTDSMIDIHKIGLIGHSEGGIIAPMVAKDAAFIIMLAGTAFTGEEILMLQSALISKAENVSEEDIRKNSFISKTMYSIVKKNRDNKKAVARMKEFMDGMYKKMTADEKDRYSWATIQSGMMQLTSPWFRFFLAYNPGKALKKVKCPLLALNGEKDLQVPSKENLKAIEDVVKKGKCKDYTVKEFPGLNHLFQHCTTGSPTEYSKIEETFSPEVLEYIKQWILACFN
ncbi:MAG: alpha/beta fold hydrolase [Bacteroidia bacterium]|nr:alpha/beta fold hydrolase [Bacteroidia bacterium]